MKLDNVTFATTVSELMDDSLNGRWRSIKDAGGIVVGQVKITLSDESWIEEQKEMQKSQK